MKNLSMNTKSNRIMEKNKELNLVEILKDCPKGTKLWSPIFGDLTFEELDMGCNPIVCRDGQNIMEYFERNGKYNDCIGAEVMLFPSKDNRDWSTFKAPKPKWNPDTLQPFDKVLARDTVTDYWGGDFYLYTDKDSGSNFIYSCVGDNYKICIPYNDDTKHLLGTNKEEPEFYSV